MSSRGPLKFPWKSVLENNPKLFTRPAEVVFKYKFNICEDWNE